MKPGPRTVAFTHVTVIDVKVGTAKPDMTVMISGDRIVAVGPAGRIRPPRDARVIEAAGKYLIPGLWDMHFHLSSCKEGAVEKLITKGITGLRDLGGDLPQIDALRSQIERGVRAGPFVDGPKEGVEFRLTVTNEAEARAAVHKLKALGADFIKVHNGLPRQAFFALADEARKRHLVFVCHLPLGVTAEEASDAGAKSHRGS